MWVGRRLFAIRVMLVRSRRVDVSGIPTVYEFRSVFVLRVDVLDYVYLYMYIQACFSKGSPVSEHTCLHSSVRQNR